MNSFLMAFGLAGIFLCVGMFLRAKVPFLRNMLVPSSVLAGLLGLCTMNVAASLNLNLGTDGNMFTDIVNHLFTISFISISLTGSGDNGEKGSVAKGIFKGALGMGLVWCLLYALTPLLGMLLIDVIGGPFNMDPAYGSLIPFAFAQGPGQAASYGLLYESYGWENAAMVGVTFSAVGFIIAFLVGIPAAKIGIARGIAKNCSQVDAVTLRGYMRPEEQTAHMNKDTTCSSNIETLSFHFCSDWCLLCAGCRHILASEQASDFGKLSERNDVYERYDRSLYRQVCYEEAEDRLPAGQHPADQNHRLDR